MPEFNTILEGSLEDLISSNRQELEDTLYSTWIINGDKYSPAVDIETSKRLPSGVYKVSYSQDNYVLTKLTLNSDEIYTFSEDFTTKIIDEINSFWDKKDLYKQNHLIHKRGMLLAGGCGVGKSSLITLLINQLIEKDGIVFLINNYKDFSLLYECISPVIRKIEPERPIITVIEDIDKIIEQNGDNDSELLDFLDGKNSIDHHVILMTSNNTSGLSDAFLRPSRVDMFFIIPSPDAVIRKEYFIKKNVPKENIAEFVKATHNMSFAQLKEVFIGTQILGKPLDQVVKQLKCPLDTKNYLNKNKTLGYG